MTDPTDRDTLEDLMTRHVLGELPGEEARRLAQLVAERPALAAEIERLRRAYGMMAYAAATPPPAELRTRVLAAAAGRATPARPPRVLTATRVVGSIAAALILTLAWDGYRLRQELA